jgi:hypothetical protein
MFHIIKEAWKKEIMETKNRARRKQEINKQQSNELIQDMQKKQNFNVS